VHKKVKPLFALQYGSGVRHLTVLQVGYPTLRTCRQSGKSYPPPGSKPEAGQAKKVGKTSENRPF
jgi:hypothetical protein